MLFFVFLVFLAACDNPQANANLRETEDTFQDDTSPSGYTPPTPDTSGEEDMSEDIDTTNDTTSTDTNNQHTNDDGIQTYQVTPGGPGDMNVYRPLTNQMTQAEYEQWRREQELNGESPEIEDEDETNDQDTNDEEDEDTNN